MEFGESTTFWDVEGIPVTLAGPEGVPYSAAWDTVPPRPFPAASVRHNGAEISRKEFDKLVASCQGGAETVTEKIELPGSGVT
jgi:hypothetical protein